MTSRAVSLLGIILIVSVAYVFSRNRRAVRWRTLGWGLGLQFLVALFVLRTQLGYRLLDKFSSGVVWLLNFSFAGSKFVFGPLGDPPGSLGFIFAFQALPLLIFLACLFSLLYLLPLLPPLVPHLRHQLF